MRISLEGDRSNWLLLLISSFLVLGTLLLVGVIAPRPDFLLKRGRFHFDRRDYDTARKYYTRVINMTAKSSGVRYEAEIFYATCSVRQNKFEESARLFRTYISDYPNGFWTPQAYFDLAYCERNLGNLKESYRLYTSIREKFPTTSWAKYSKDRLKEFEGELGEL